MGALSNPDSQTRLRRIQAIRKRHAGQLAPISTPLVPPKRPTRRNGWVTDTVVQVLAQANVPVSPAEVRTAVEQLAGEPVPGSSVTNCLTREALRPNGRFERVGYGRYRLRTQ